MNYLIGALLLLASAVQAREFIPEAAVREGYGPTQTSWALYYPGVCGERVSAQIAFQGRAKLDTVVPELHRYARSTVTHLQQRCPNLQTIHVAASGRATSPPAIYLFSMHRDSDWQPVDNTWYADRLQTMTDKGYLPFEVNVYKHGLMRLQDGVFDAFYGRYFENYMRSERVQQHMLEGVNPPRVSHYTITGSWYEFGDKRSDKVCSSTENGYPYWGSFVLSFSPRANTANLQKKACTTAGGQGQGERLYVSNSNALNFKRVWGIDKVASLALLGEQVARMNLQPQTHDRASFEQSRTPVYEDARIKLFPRRENWCLRVELDAVYRAEHETRDSAFAGSYVKFLSGIVWDLVNDHCGKPLVLGIDNYREGESERWDSMSFLLERPNKSGFEPVNEKYVELSGHFLGARAKEHRANLNANHLGKPCVDGPFCELDGGRYLNAIYRGDVATVREIDRQHATELAAMIDKTGTAFGIQANNPISNLFKEQIASSSFVEDVTNKYMYAYAAWGRQCYKPGAEDKTFRYTTPVVIETDPWGVTTRSGGEVYEATYTTNPEFFELRDRLGSHGGAQNSDSPTIMKTKRLVYKGLVAMKDHYACHGAKVTQFEHNLRQIAVAQLNGSNPTDLRRASSSDTVTPPAAASDTQTTGERVQQTSSATPLQTAPPAPPLPEPRTNAQPEAPVTPQSAVAAPGNNAVPADRNAVPATPAAPPPQLSQEEIYAQRNAQIQALNADFIARVNALNESFKQDSNNAASDQERLDIMRAFQQKMQALRAEVNERTSEIKNKYR